MVTCHHCGLEITEAIGFRAICPSCDSYLHCCLNCRLYSASASNHCLSPTTEFVGDVSGANFCEEYDPQAGKKTKDVGAAKKRFDQLFGDPG